MNQKYIIIFLLISIIITISCKCNKLNINEHFNEESAGTNSIDNSDINPVTITNITDNNINFEDCLNDVNLNIKGIYDIFNQIIDESKQKLDNLNKYDGIITNLNGEWNNIKETLNSSYFEGELNHTITDLANKEIFNVPDDNASNDCEKYVKPYESNKIINNNISGLLNKNSIWKKNNTNDSDDIFENEVVKEKDIYIGESNGLKQQLNYTLDKFKDIKKTLTETDTSIFGELQKKVTDKRDDLKKNLIDNSNNIDRLIEDFKTLIIPKLQEKINNNNNKINQINNIFDTDNNFITSVEGPHFNGINKNDDSIKKHCNIGGLMNGSGICYSKDYQGCFIDCETKKNTGECAFESELGKPNPSRYTNVFGSSINVHKHAHKHPGPHPHK
jgi:hypothetical protein